MATEAKTTAVEKMTDKPVEIKKDEKGDINTKVQLKNYC